MRVQELIDLLQEEDPEAIIVTRAYEEGVDIVRDLKRVLIKESGQEQWYYGDFSISEDEMGDSAILLAYDK